MAPTDPDNRFGPDLPYDDVIDAEGAPLPTPTIDELLAGTAEPTVTL